jgi:glycosyltransferase involved in cell wall biosynthesis
VSAAPLGVLSIGYSRGLWGPPDAEDVLRLTEYGRHLERYVHLVHSRRAHGLRPTRVNGVLDALPTGARTAAGSFARILRMGGALLRQGGFSLVQAQDPVFTGAAALALGRRFGLPVNVCVYGSDVFDPHWRRAHWTNALGAPLGRAVLARADGVQVDGAMAARSLAAAGIPAGRIRVKPMIPANLDAFFALPRPRPGGGPVRLLFVGRLHHQKNLPLLAQVFERVSAGAAGEVELQVVGAGREEGRFRERVRAGGVEGRVAMRGALGREGVVEAFAGADLLVLTSHYEGNPRVLMEAAAAGLPIVTTAVGGCDEWVEEGVSGFVVPVGDGAAHADRVLRLAGDAALRARMGAASRAAAAARVASAGDPAHQVRIWHELVERHRHAGARSDIAVPAGRRPDPINREP